MDTLAAITPAQRLADFCTEFLSRHKEKWPGEGTLAREFAERFPIGQLSNTEQIVAFAKELGVDASLDALPERIYGFNCSNGERTLVVLSEQEAFPGSREHTFFHELREIIEYRFREQGQPTASGAELEKRAELFATEVRLAQMMKMLGPLFADANAIEQTWKRWAAIAGIIALILGAGAACFLLPYFEEQFPRTRLKQ